MTPDIRTYSVLLVSAAQKGNNTLVSFFPGDRFEPVTVAGTVAAARRRLSDRDYDLVIVNAPLPDDFGRKFAADVCAESERVALLLVRSDVYDGICSQMTPRGVLVAKKPLDALSMAQILNGMCSVRERMRTVGKKTMTLEDKMEEIRLVNRAKWALISACRMTEEDAHRYIQKKAMDLCLSKKEAAESILRIYGPEGK